MLIKTQVIAPPDTDQAFGLSHDFCCDGNTLAVRSHNTKTKQESLYLYRQHNGEYYHDATYSPHWWKDNHQVSIRGINNSIYFVAIDTDNRVGHVIRYNNGGFYTVISIDDCDNTLGMNDKSIAVSKDEERVAVTNFRVKNNTKEKTLLYSSEIVLYDCVTRETKIIHTPQSIQYNRSWSFRSLAFAGDQLLAGSPDLTFDIDNDGTMDRKYYGPKSLIDIFDLEGNHTGQLVARDATPGNFFGTEFEVSRDQTTLIVMAPAQDNKIGCAYQFKYMDDRWVQVGKYSPRDFAVHTKIKYSLYGCCVNSDGSRFLLSDGLPGVIYSYGDKELVSSYKENQSNYNWFGFDIRTNESFTVVAVSEYSVEQHSNARGALHIFNIT